MPPAILPTSFNLSRAFIAIAPANCASDDGRANRGKATLRAGKLAEKGCNYL